MCGVPVTWGQAAVQEQQHPQLKVSLPREAFTWKEWDKLLQEAPSQKCYCQHLLGVGLLLLSVGKKNSAPALGEIKKLPATYPPVKEKDA